jgi:hypothetical protein
MLPAQTEMETFLLADLALSLSNIRAHLDWEARYTQSGTVTLTAESVKNLSERLLSIESKGKSLARALRTEVPEGQGLTEVLLRLESGFAA